MSEPGSRRGRLRDAEGSREAILNAAEEAFAEHGFDGARVDAIAAAAGYNKSLIFQHFGDKLGLYVEIIRKADEEMTEIQEQLLTPLLEDETIIADASRFRALLSMIAGTLFDYLQERARLIRILNWEVAEGFQTYAKIVSQFPQEDTEVLRVLFQKAQRAGLMHSDFSPLVQLTLVLFICMSYLSWVSVLETTLGEDLTSTSA